MPPASDAQQDARYLAVVQRDIRFDGRFFTGVTSTGVYCRPVCKVRAPKKENCKFFELPAQAEAAGFRPCLRCRPELAPARQAWSVQDASASLAQSAVDLIDQMHPASQSMTTLAEHLGVTDRHLRRVTEQRFGVGPLQYAQTRKLLLAKQLLADTTMPVAQVATVSGFGSVRRFNAAFADAYRLSPGQVRKLADGSANDPQHNIKLHYRMPYDVKAFARFLLDRQLNAIEYIATTPYSLLGCRLFSFENFAKPSSIHSGWLRFELRTDKPEVRLSVSAGLTPVLPLLIQRVRHWLDLDCEIQDVDEALAPWFANAQGMRLPGGLSGFELAVRAVLGQQVTVAAARTFAARLVERFGTPLNATDKAGLAAALQDSTGLDDAQSVAVAERMQRCFPLATQLAQASPDALGELGIVKQRQCAIIALARAVAEGGLVLDGPIRTASARAHVIEHLQSLPGIGAWTAQYVAMRALRDPDAWPAADVVMHKRLGLQAAGLSATAAAKRCAELGERFAPWRSYAVIRAWAHHEDVLPSFQKVPS
jgi:AraC family transcriptional regulator of adaptative response / DNA-3-methyladenine glycosylase II